MSIRNNYQNKHKEEQYVDLKSNGRLFPTWILLNFKKYKLPEIFRKEGEDPCNVQTKFELRKYQEFIGKYLGPGSPYNEILLYHGLGSGKTATSINMLNILYNYDPSYNFIILIKAALKDDPWMKDLKTWLGRDPDETNIEGITKLARYSHIHFVHYDSPYADKDFFELLKRIDTSKPTMYVIDEAHNFIRNVYSNINSKVGKRAQNIYEYIVREKRETQNTKIVLISATPGINTPFELALTFNMLRPGIFPSSESEFIRIFISESNYPILNPLKKNMFQRRIMGLVSYYIGATPDLYARKDLKYITLPMSKYQYDVYRFFEKKEAEIQKKARKYGKSSKLYRTYTRQACNFVFPVVNSFVNGEMRPRPGNFKLSEKTAESVEKGKSIKDEDAEHREALSKYMKAIEMFLTATENYFKKIHEDDVKAGRTIFNDLEEFKKGFDEKYGGKFFKYYKSESPKSNLFNQLYDCSPKMLAITFMSYMSPGKVMIYSNYVVMEGIDVMKIYLKLAGFNTYSQTNKEFFGYCEYHGRIDPAQRVAIKNMYNEPTNIKGKQCKIILLSPSATEGIQLYGIRQEHILEPYWTEVRIEQVIGRGVRQCSHKDLPMDERVVNIYRYKVSKPDKLDDDDTVRISTDEHVEDQAKAKDNLIQSFLGAMKEVAVDCELFRAHNMMSQNYPCFRFPEETITGKYVGPAYKEDIKEDVKYDSELNAKNVKVEKIKVIKIMAVFRINPESEPEPKYSGPEKFWLYPETNMVYDYETHYPVGLITVDNGIPLKLDKDTYILSTMIDIPTIENNY